MKCPNCQAENDSNVRFCAECGAPMRQQPAPRQKAPGGIYCAKCSKPNPPDSTFCENCGNRLDSQPRPPATQARPARAAAPAATARTSAPQPAATNQQQEKQPTSWAWWLLPIFLTWIGGLIGFLVVRDNDKGKANGLLILGIIMTVFWIILGIGASAASIFFNF